MLIPSASDTISRYAASFSKFKMDSSNLSFALAHFLYRASLSLAYALAFKYTDPFSNCALVATPMP